MKARTGWRWLRRQWLGGLAIFLAGITTLPGHDASEITAKARLHADRIEVEFTMAYATALRLLPAGQGPVSTSPKKFAEIKAALERQAPAWAVLLAEGGPVAARQAVVELTRDDEIRLQFEFPSAAFPVRLDALLLRVLASEHYHCLLSIYGPGKNEVRYEVLRLGKRTGELRPAGG